MAAKKPLKGIHVLLFIWVLMILYMGYTLFLNDIAEVDEEMSTSAAIWEAENRDLLLAANNASEKILINGKIINKSTKHFIY